MTNINTAADMALGVRGEGVLGESAPINSGSAAFYRIRQVLLTQPLDTDGDGLDDVTELRHPEFFRRGAVSRRPDLGVDFPSAFQVRTQVPSAGCPPLQQVGRLPAPTIRGCTTFRDHCRLFACA